MTDAELAVDREWTIKDIKIGKEWSNDYGKFQGYSMALVGLGEPVKLNKAVPVTEHPIKGQVLYGHLELETGDGFGRSYWRFQGAPRGVIDGTHQLAKEPPVKTEAVRVTQSPNPEAVAAVQLAVDVWHRTGEVGDQAAYENIETEATHFYNMIQRIKKL